MQAKSFNTPLELEIHDMIDGIEANAMILKLKGQKLDDNVQSMIKQFSSMQFYLADIGKRRMQDFIDKEDKLDTPQQVVCMHCNKQVMSISEGTEMNNGYECNIFYCNNCDKNWVDYMPADANDRLKWHLNFITQAERLSNEKKMDIPPAQLEEMKAGYQKMVKLQNDVLEKEAAALQAEEDAQKALLIFKNSLIGVANSLNDFVKRNVANA